MKNKAFFEKCRIYWWEGYYIPIRNSWNFHIEKVHLTDKEKVLYEKEFGETLLLDNEFNEWYTSLKKNKKLIL